jgi:nitrite reductase (NO-forming)
MKKTIILIIAVLIILIGGAYLIFGQSQKDKTTINIQETDNINNSQKVFKIIGKNFKFYSDNVENPDLKVKLGDKIRIEFANEEGFHDFVIDEFSAKTPQIGAGKISTVEFTADKLGTFQYYCSVGTHRQMGMKGNFIVE